MRRLALAIALMAVLSAVPAASAHSQRIYQCQFHEVSIVCKFYKHNRLVTKVTRRQTNSCVTSPAGDVQICAAKVTLRVYRRGPDTVLRWDEQTPTYLPVQGPPPPVSDDDGSSQPDRAGFFCKSSSCVVLDHDGSVVVRFEYDGVAYNCHDYGDVTVCERHVTMTVYGRNGDVILTQNRVEKYVDDGSKGVG